MQLGFAALHIVEQIVDFGETAHGHFQSRKQLGFLIRLGDVCHGTCTRGLLDQIGLGECRKHNDRSDILITDDTRRFDAIHTRHLDVHAYHAWMELAGQFDCFLTVSGFAHNLVATIFQHGNQIHTVHGFVFGHDDGTLARFVIFLDGLLRRCGSLKFIVGEHFVRFRGLFCRHVGLFPLSHPKPVSQTPTWSWTDSMPLLAIVRILEIFSFSQP